MDDINFDNIDDYEEYPVLPAGTYLCQLVNIHERATNAGDQMWGLEFIVMDEGKNQWKKIFDNMVFSEKAMSRVKLIASRLGVKVQGTMNLSVLKGEIMNKSVYIEVTIEDYDNKKQNKVPFAGYTEIQNQSKPNVNENSFVDDDIPFD